MIKFNEFVSKLSPQSLEELCNYLSLVCEDEETDSLLEDSRAKIIYQKKGADPDVFARMSKLANRSSRDNPGDKADHLKFLLRNHQNIKTKEDEDNHVKALKAFSANKRNLLRRDQNINKYESMNDLHRAAAVTPESQIERLGKSDFTHGTNRNDLLEYHRMAARNHRQAAAETEDKQKSDAHMSAASAHDEIYKTGKSLDDNKLKRLSKSAAESTNRLSGKHIEPEETASTENQETEKQDPVVKSKDDSTPHISSEDPSMKKLAQYRDAYQKRADLHEKFATWHEKNGNADMARAHREANFHNQLAVHAMNKVLDTFTPTTHWDLQRVQSHVDAANRHNKQLHQMNKNLIAGSRSTSTPSPAASSVQPTLTPKPSLFSRLKRKLSSTLGKSKQNTQPSV